MVAASYSTPLSALDAVVLDTETTGLDSRSARLLQVGAVKVEGTVIRYAERFDRLVNPGVPIPKANAAVHGITDERVRDAPPFRAIAADLASFIGSGIVVGHTITYDLEILRREHELAGLTWRPWRALDIRFLARLAAPTLAHHNLDRLCDWLEIEVDGRHTAIGDAEATAKVFVALIPLLRQRGIRTLAEAEAAGRQLAELEARSTSGFTAAQPVAAADDTRTLARIDSFPYRHRVRDVMSTPPVFAPPGASVFDVIKMLIAQKVSSVYVRDGEGNVGIVTERDVLREIDAAGPDGLSTRVEEVMNTPLQTVSEEAFVYRAIGRMDRLGFRHLGVRNANGEITGAVTTRNLLRHRASHAIVLGDEIDSAETVAALGRAWARLPLMARSLLGEDVDCRTIAEVISSEIRILTRRAAQLAEREMADKGRGNPPVPYAVLVLGSGGRGESLLAADQDNAIVYAEGAESGPEDRWFAEMATRLAAILDEVGLPFCKGGVMAKNRTWRMSLADWKTTVDGWLRRQRPQDLLSVDIFFDAMPVHGDASLGEAIWHYALDRGRDATDFQKLLTENSARRQTAVGLFGGLKVDEKGRVDVKLSGLMPVFGGARVLAIRHGIRARSSPDRLRAVMALGIGNAGDVDRVIEAHRVMLGAVLRQQLMDTEAGVPLSSRVDPAALGRETKGALAKAFGDVGLLTDLVLEGRM
jgi:DNA polymerase-3 subunit epsilon/CBS domain-containing protein